MKRVIITVDRVYRPSAAVFGPRGIIDFISSYVILLENKP
jgi:hypothetical protein